MKNVRPIRLLIISSLLSLVSLMSWGAESLETGWSNPPRDARIRAYWWWLNGNVTREAITRDLEEMKAKGWGGALICDAGGAEQDGNGTVPHGPTFFSPEWRALYKHTLQEANRLGLEMSLNILSGWNLGGPIVSADDAAKKLVWSEIRASGGKFDQQLPAPQSRDNYYRDVFVVAYRLKSAPAKDGAGVKSSGAGRGVQNWEQKAMHKPLHFSAPDTRLLIEDVPAQPGEEDTVSTDVVDLTTKLGPDGRLQWEVPKGEWQILRFGCTIGDHSRVSTSSDGWKGYALDVLDAGALNRYLDAIVEPLIADAGTYAGTTLKYLHTDSWEVEPVNWTPSFPAEFKKRHGYDLTPYLPVLAGRIVDNREISNRFLHDFRKTLGDLAIDNHYRVFRERAHRHGLQIHPESGGPHAVPIDAQRCLGWNDAPMSEFWAWSWRHRIGDENRFFVKQPASAAHTYGRPMVLAEGFTTIGPHWQETIWDNLKPSFDKAICEGFNLLYWHAFVCSPESMGIPGQQYFAGTHFNPNSTWWSRSAGFVAYLNRAQFLMQRGHPVADVCYYYGDHVPNFAQLKKSDPAGILPGYDYDVITEEALLTRMSVQNGRLVLPDGMSYAVLALPNQPAISSTVLARVRELVEAGAIVVGSRPHVATGLADHVRRDAEVVRIAAALWGTGSSTTGERALGKGRVIWGKSTRTVLSESGLSPDLECQGAVAGSIDYFHRNEAGTDIYFVANRSNRVENVEATFRVTDRAPELWNLVTGERRFATAYRSLSGRTTVPLEFAPCGSWAVVFREPASQHPATSKENGQVFEVVSELRGPWQVRFDPRWGGPESVEFPELVSWTTRAEEGIKFYSGTATYRRSFDMPPNAGGKALWLDLGMVRELAQVRLNGQDLGGIWCPPFRVNIAGLVRSTGNALEVEVVNFWPNRIIGDDSQPVAKRLTQTNIRKLTRSTPLTESGLFGPVRILCQQ